MMPSSSMKEAVSTSQSTGAPATTPRLSGLAAEEKKRRQEARRKLIPYSDFTLPRWQTSWHLEMLARELEGVAWGWTKRLMVFMPPRHGKSETGSVRFPTWYLGNHPQDQVILASYADSLARTMSRACLSVIKGPAFQKLFPGTTLEKDNEAMWQFTGKENGRPSFIAAGVGGGISGQGANLLIIDDPVKNAEEADSIVMRDKAWDWYLSTARTRLQANAAIVLIMTRWHQDDLAGRILAMAKANPDADQWKVILLPAVNVGKECIPEDIPPYDALWPSQYDAHTLRETEATSRGRVWTSLYKQRPTQAEGTIIKREKLRFYVREGDEMPDGFSLPGYDFTHTKVLPRRFEQEVQSWDMSFKDKATSDFVSGQVWGRQEADKYLLDRVNRRMGFWASIEAIRMFCVKWPNAYQIFIEDKANGTAIIETLRSELGGVTPVEPIGDKGERLQVAAIDVDSGNVYLPHPLIAPWIVDLIEQLCAFPNGLFDDDVDAFSQAISKMRLRGGGFYTWLQGEVKRDEVAQMEEKAKEFEPVYGASASRVKDPMAHMPKLPTDGAYEPGRTA